MGGRKIEWQDVEWEYMSGDMGLRQLAEKRGINYNTIKSKAIREKWSERRARKQKEEKRGKLEQVMDRLLLQLMDTLARGSELEARELKALSGALKELGELDRQLHEGSGKDRGELIVRLEGELEELGR